MADNLNHWLRAVRPDTAADHDWTGSPEAERLLAAIQRAQRTQPTQRAQRTRRIRRGWQPLLGAAAAAAVVTVLVTTAGNRAGPNNPIGTDRTGIATLPAIRPAAMLLSSTDSCGKLLADLRSHTAAAVSAYGLPNLTNLPNLPGNFRVPLAEGDSQSAQSAQSAKSAQSAAPATNAISATNVQEPGVDEPDIVKTEPGRVISLVGGTLRVIDAASQRVTGTLELGMYAGVQSAQLLVDGDHALVLLGSDYAGPSHGPMISSPIQIQSQSARSTYLFIDLSGRPAITASMRVDGAYLDARQVGSTVRLVVHSAPALAFPASSSVAANRRLVNVQPLTSWLPKYSITVGSTSTESTVPCGQVSHPAAYSGTSLLTIYTLDLDHLSTDARPVTVAADGDTVYATSSSLYLASNPDWYCCAMASLPNSQRTQLHRFDISATSRPTYLGSASVAGRLLSQYSLSEYGGSLRIATTMAGADGQPGSSSSVYVLDAASLKVTGHLDGLGISEQIYAVRFDGPMAYLVTFRQTDPLYLVDLHDPAHPKLAGSLQLTGYSNYLHDLGQGRLLGVGQEASALGKVAGLQVSLFDIGNPAKPSRIGHVVRTEAVDEGQLDPHAFLYWQPTGLVVVPIQSWTSAESGKVLVLRVTGHRLTTVGLVANPSGTARVADGLGIQRSLIVDGALWTVSSGGIQVSDQGSLARQAWISFG